MPSPSRSWSPFDIAAYDVKSSHGLWCESWEGTGTQEKNHVAIQVCVCGLLIRLFQARLGSQKVPEDMRPCLVKGLVAVAGCS